MKSNTQLSPHLEKCCLLLSANVSYANTARDLESLTGLRISHSTQQRLVQRHKFPAVWVNQEVEELTVDGGKVRLRTPKGLGCEWRDYKAVNLDGQAVAAYFQDNKALLNWVNQQQLSEFQRLTKILDITIKSNIDLEYKLSKVNSERLKNEYHLIIE